jgi:NMD protein affecting ribosome stability and mRNA decay
MSAKLQECPICNRKYAANEIESHVNTCLDRKETKRQLKEDEKLAQQLASTNISPVVIHN